VPEAARQIWCCSSSAGAGPGEGRCWPAASCSGGCQLAQRPGLADELWQAAEQVAAAGAALLSLLLKFRLGWPEVPPLIGTPDALLSPSASRPP